MVCGSIVLPDFEEWMTSVVFGSHSDMMARTRTGETESMVLNEMSEESALLYFVSVMGACVESALPHEHDRFQTACDQGISEVLNLGKRQRRLTCQRGPAHEITGEKLGIFGEVEKVAVLGVNTTRNLVIDERLRRSTGRSCFKINHRFLPELSMDQPFRLVCLILPK